MPETEIDLTKQVERGDGISVIGASENCRDWNGIHYKVGMSAKNVGSTKLSMNVATIPPGGVARAHVHVGFEVMLYILRGVYGTSTGPASRRWWRTRRETSSSSSRECRTRSSTR